MPLAKSYHRVMNGKFSQPEELRNEDKFQLDLYTTGGQRRLIFTVDGFLRHVVNEMNKHLKFLNKKRPPFTEEEVKPFFLKFIRHQHLDISNPTVHVMSIALRELVLSGVFLFGTEKDIEGNFSSIKPLVEDIKK